MTLYLKFFPFTETLFILIAYEEKGETVDQSHYHWIHPCPKPDTRLRCHCGPRRKLNDYCLATKARRLGDKGRQYIGRAFTYLQNGQRRLETICVEGQERLDQFLSFGSQRKENGEREGVNDLELFDDDEVDRPYDETDNATPNTAYDGTRGERGRRNIGPNRRETAGKSAVQKILTTFPANRTHFEADPNNQQIFGEFLFDPKAREEIASSAWFLSTQHWNTYSLRK